MPTSRFWAPRPLAPGAYEQVELASAPAVPPRGPQPRKGYDVLGMIVPGEAGHDDSSYAVPVPAAHPAMLSQMPQPMIGDQVVHPPASSALGEYTYAAPCTATRAPAVDVNGSDLAAVRADRRTIICSYSSAMDGMRCKSVALSASAQCEVHTCQQPRCSNPKSSREKHCTEHQVDSGTSTTA